MTRFVITMLFVFFASLGVLVGIDWVWSKLMLLMG